MIKDNILLKMSSSCPRPTPITTLKSSSYPLIVKLLALALTNLDLDLTNLVTNLAKQSNGGLVTYLTKPRLDLDKLGQD